jgi:anti-sigma regulatory factor (Ser/Thr protein kinase)
MTADDPGLLAEAAAAFSDVHGLGPRAAMSLTLILEEVMTNVSHHGAGPEGAIVNVRVRQQGGIVWGEIRDSGKAFDPLTRPPVDVTASLEEREVGGLGIHLVKTLARTLAYRREGAENVLTFTLEREP